MSLVTFAPTEAMQVTLRPRVYKVDIGKVGFQGAQGPSGTAAATSYTYAGLPGGSAGQFAWVTDGNKGLYRHNGTEWVRFEGQSVNASDFGVVYSTIAAPIDVSSNIQDAFDALDNLSGFVIFEPPRQLNAAGAGFGSYLHMGSSVVVREGQGAASTGGPIGVNGPFSGVGVNFRALAGLAGEPMFKDLGYDNDPVNDFAHAVTFTNLGFQGAGIASCAIVLNQAGEEQWIRGCNAREFTEAAYIGTGIHASFLIEWSSGWECPYVVKLTHHPTQADGYSGGNCRLLGVSGDLQTEAHVYADGAHHIGMLYCKSEQTSVGVHIHGYVGLGAGGDAAVLSVVSSTFNGSGAGGGNGDLFLLTGTSHATINCNSVIHSNSYLNVLKDEVRTITRTVADYPFLLNHWSHNGSSDFGEEEFTISTPTIKMRRPSTQAKTAALEYNADDIIHHMGGAAGASLDDQNGVKVVYVVSSVAEITGLIRPEADGTRDLGQSIDGVFERRFKDTYIKGFHDLTELASDAAAPPTNHARVYTKDNGSGKTQLCVRFPTGAVQVLATEP